MPQYTEAQARQAIADSYCYAEALRKLGLLPHGGNHRMFRKWVDEVWKIPTTHFDSERVRRSKLSHHCPSPLAEVLVEHSSYDRASLKRRLYSSGLKRPICELCGQGELWRGGRMALVLDHINGIPDDNRLENLRIVCPNCNATLDTHCGRKNLQLERRCRCCGRMFQPKLARQKYCSVQCGRKHPDGAGNTRRGARRVKRPSYPALSREIRSTTMVKVGAKYGVSDNAVRKWVRSYKRTATPEGDFTAGIVQAAFDLREELTAGS